MELKPQFDRIQSLFSHCIGHAYQVLTDGIAAKSAYLDSVQADESERQEYIRIADELSQLYLRYSVLSDIRNCYSDPAFFWEGGLFEAMNPGEKRKYLHYKPQGKMLYFEKAELEAWLRKNPVKTQGQIEQQAQKYILDHPSKK